MQRPALDQADPVVASPEVEALAIELSGAFLWGHPSPAAEPGWVHLDHALKRHPLARLDAERRFVLALQLHPEPAPAATSPETLIGRDGLDDKSRNLHSVVRHARQRGAIGQGNGPSADLHAGFAHGGWAPVFAPGDQGGYDHPGCYGSTGC